MCHGCRKDTKKKNTLQIYAHSHTHMAADNLVAMYKHFQQQHLSNTQMMHTWKTRLHVVTDGSSHKSLCQKKMVHVVLITGVTQARLTEES